MIPANALPCPFCGGDDIRITEGSTFRWLVAGCNECGAQACEVRKRTLGNGTPDEWQTEAARHAVVAWNTRTNKC